MSHILKVKLTKFTFDEEVLSHDELVETKSHFTRRLGADGPMRPCNNPHHAHEEEVN